MADLTADLATLKRHLGITSTSDDVILQGDLDASEAWVADRVDAGALVGPECQLAVVLLASRLYKRRQTPEGVAGWANDVSIPIIARDPDVVALIGLHRDQSRAGIG